MIRVRTGSRLHFGLLSLAGSERWPNLRGEDVLPARHYGGVGMMVESPSVQVALTSASEWSAEGPLASRALEFAHRFLRTLPDAALPPQHLVIECSAAEHSGLGAGTQLALAVARGLAVRAGLDHLDAIELGRRTGRGTRSSIGIHGFGRGGFLVESGKGPGDTVAPLAVRAVFPENWRLVLVLPPGEGPWHGRREEQAFASLGNPAESLARTEALCRLVLLGLLPALVQQDLEAFGEALFDFNVRVGEAFAPVQGGTYASPLVAALVAFLRRQGARGTGQSSWGQTVFAVVAGDEPANDLAGQVRRHFDLDVGRTLVVRAANEGATILQRPSSSSPLCSSG
jgi:beta-RFAP synthase